MRHNWKWFVLFLASILIVLGPCTQVNFTRITAVNGKNVAFSVSLLQLKNLKQTTDFESFSFQATISVSSINNKRADPVSAIVNVQSIIFVNVPVLGTTS